MYMPLKIILPQKEILVWSTTAFMSLQKEEIKQEEIH